MKLFFFNIQNSIIQMDTLHPKDTSLRGKKLVVNNQRSPGTSSTYFTQFSL